MWVVFPWNTCSLPRQQRKLGRTQRVSNAAMSLTTTGLTLMSTVVRSTWRIVEEEQSKNHASIQFIILSFYRRSLSIRPILERFSVAYAAKFLATLLINCYIVEVTKSFKKKSQGRRMDISLSAFSGRYGSSEGCFEIESWVTGTYRKWSQAASEGEQKILQRVATFMQSSKGKNLG